MPAPGNAPTLYVVATPIGNLGDLTQRARETLASVTRIFAEDTRRTRALLTHLGIGGKAVIRVDANIADERVERLIETLAPGESAAVVSDAGVPGVSDPGSALVRAAAARGLRVVAIPGPSALTAAIAASGLVEGPFSFLAFLPRHGKKRRLALERVAKSAEPIVLFEAPQRLPETLRDLAELCPARQIAVCRELTKLHEEIVRGTLAELAATEREWLGEATLVLGAHTLVEEPESELSHEQIEAELLGRLEKGAHPRDLSIEFAARLGIPRREAYARVLAARDKR
jgi:16S rRNA (cytidine1402-2'-O)-methyltransferase